MSVYMPTRGSTWLHERLQAYTRVYKPTRVSTGLHECPQALQIKVTQYAQHNTYGNMNSFFPVNTDRVASLMHTHTYIHTHTTHTHTPHIHTPHTHTPRTHIHIHTPRARTHTHTPHTYTHHKHIHIHTHTPHHRVPSSIHYYLWLNTIYIYTI